jgi:hypothetical protein
MTNFHTLTFKRLSDGRVFQVRGQVARTLLALIVAQERGCTALELSTWALRLAHYVLCLRRLGLDIPLERENHPGGWHGRYRLVSGVEILRLREAA